MDIESYLSSALIPLLVTAGLIYYGIRLLVLHDVSSVRGKDKKKPKNEQMYASTAGKLMLFLAASSLVMAVIVYWNAVLALAEFGICVVIFAILWKNMDEKYG